MEPQRVERRRPFLASRLAEDPELLAEVETAEKLQISLKRFRGWEPTTSYTHRGGRLVSSTPEPEWDEQEQGWMLALRLYRQVLCPNCSGDLNITAASENEGRFRYQPPLQCFRCVAMSESHEASKDQPHQLSLLHVVPWKPGLS